MATFILNANDSNLPPDKCPPHSRDPNGDTLKCNTKYSSSGGTFECDSRPETIKSSLKKASGSCRLMYTCTKNNCLKEYLGKTYNIAGESAFFVNGPKGTVPQR